MRIELTTEQVEALRPLFEAVTAAAREPGDQRGMLVAQIYSGATSFSHGDYSCGFMRVGFLKGQQYRELVNKAVDPEQAAVSAPEQQSGKP